MPTLPKDHFAGASLLLLVYASARTRRRLWAVILQLRVIFSGSRRTPRHRRLAAPLLVAPLQGFTETSRCTCRSRTRGHLRRQSGDSFAA